MTGPQGVALRRAIWRHNSYLGQAACMVANARNIAQAETTTDLSRAYAREIMELAERLQNSLRERR